MVNVITLKCVYTIIRLRSKTICYKYKKKNSNLTERTPFAEFEYRRFLCWIFFLLLLLIFRFSTQKQNKQKSFRTIYSVGVYLNMYTYSLILFGHLKQWLFGCACVCHLLFWNVLHSSELFNNVYKMDCLLWRLTQTH